MKLEEAYGMIRAAIGSNRAAHAYVVEAPPRTVGMAFAESVLKAWFCTDKIGACGVCEPCRQVAGHGHADILWVEPQKKSRIISIDQVRDLRSRISQTSFTGRGKACVISGADRLGDEASNALLKTLEEPSGRSLFLLLTDSPQTLMPTIVSRCQRITISEEEDFSKDAWMSEWVSALAELSEKPEFRSTGVIGEIASAGRLAGILKSVKESVEAEETAAAGRGGSADVDEDTIDARTGARYREARTRLMRALLWWHRDVLMLVCGMDQSSIYFSAHLDTLKKLAAGLSTGEALRNIGMVEESAELMDRNIPERPALEAGLAAR